MRSAIPVGGDAAVDAALVSLIEVLTAPHVPDRSDHAGWAALLPDWLLRRFATPATREQKLAWLEQWRRMSPERQAAAEAERGWELGQWLYWVLGAGGLWRLAGYDHAAPGGGLRVVLEHDDDPFPQAALTWMIDVAGGEAGEAVPLT
ncbi:hypothetical protein [Catenulispora subtropica]|uniref:Uncharacterized protein n=1 Tax=Catenulispora subtropica TaxID=450798 RepID=A0ABN2QQT6_9ACTN